MAKDSISSLKDFVGRTITAIMVQVGSEEITGEIASNKDGVIKLIQESRGSTYTYRVPANETVFVKSDAESKMEKGETVTLERVLNRRKKIQGRILAIDGTHVVLDLGEKRGSMVTSVFPLSSLEEISYREQTAEGKKASKAKSERMKAAKTSKKSEKGEKKSGKKLKLLKKKAA